MGGYGLYVWGSYAVTFACIAIELATLALRHRNALQMNAKTGVKA
jgi:heme exporter protein CcmD